MAKKKRIFGVTASEPEPNLKPDPEIQRKPDNWEALTGQDRINYLANLFPQVKDFLGK